VRAVLVIAVACGSPPAVTPTPPSSPPGGHTADGRNVRLSIDGERIAALAPGDASTWLWPPMIDSHVHLALYPVADQLAQTGVLGAVDLAAPERTLAAPSPISIVAAGPMLTHPGGYPLDAWGADGYGVDCGDAATAKAIVDRLAAAGARVVKVALDEDGLDPKLLPAVVEAAHAHRMKVAAHALSDASAAAAAAAGVDVLAHTPVEPLRDATVAAWRGRTVISTLAAFGGSPPAIENLRRLRAAGATVLYGTDLGNLRDAGPSAQEIELLRRAGLDDASIVDAMTTAPAAFWGFDFKLAPGAPATFLVLDRDPRRDASALLAPKVVWNRGTARPH
jgi:hypothetical protein